MAVCFCGCGRKVGFGRGLAQNKAGEALRRDALVLRGAGRGEVADEADQLADEVAAVIHGEMDRKQLDKDAMGRVDREAQAVRRAAAGQAISLKLSTKDFVELLHAGPRAPAEIVRVERVRVGHGGGPLIAELTVEVRPPGAAPYEVTKNVYANRGVPKVGEHLDVAYDPDDPTRIAFQENELYDDQDVDPNPEPVDTTSQLERLHELRVAGALTDTEFERLKAELLT